MNVNNNSSSYSKPLSIDTNIHQLLFHSMAAASHQQQQQQQQQCQQQQSSSLPTTSFLKHQLPSLEVNNNNASLDVFINFSAYQQQQQQQQQLVQPPQQTPTPQPTPQPSPAQTSLLLDDTFTFPPVDSLFVSEPPSPPTPCISPILPQRSLHTHQRQQQQQQQFPLQIAIPTPSSTLPSATYSPLSTASTTYENDHRWLDQVA
ncbi:hypothetical protein HK102_012017, partial [Quaeritorhiza haematococci]